jgi:hypothetical protein
MSNMNRSTYKDPTWWNETHSSAWERTKEALRRDWEQTKADVSSSGRDLNQDAGDTLKQAAGKAPLPPGNAPNPPDRDDDLEWSDAEPALRYGHGARDYYGTSEWNDDLELKLRKDWDAQDQGNNTWARVKHAVRRGWESAKRAV